MFDEDGGVSHGQLTDTVDDSELTAFDYEWPGQDDRQDGDVGGAGRPPGASGDEATERGGRPLAVRDAPRLDSLQLRLPDDRHGTTDDEDETARRGPSGTKKAKKSKGTVCLRRAICVDLHCHKFLVNMNSTFMHRFFEFA